jgi:hypothetical protein
MMLALSKETRIVRIIQQVIESAKNTCAIEAYHERVGLLTSHEEVHERVEDVLHNPLA